MCEVFDLRKFEESVASGKPMMVDFERMVRSVQSDGTCYSSELAKEYEGRIVVGSCDVEEQCVAVRFRYAMCRPCCS